MQFAASREINSTEIKGQNLKLVTTSSKLYVMRSHCLLPYERKRDASVCYVSKVQKDMFVSLATPTAMLLEEILTNTETSGPIYKQLTKLLG